MEARPSLRLKTIACEVLARQVYLEAARSPHVVDVDLLERGLHDNADVLRRELQRRIDVVSNPPYDAIVLVYGLCNRATEGLIARDVPLVMARAHDCITLYLGSRERYAAQFDRHPGTYYYSAEYMERGKNGRAAADGVDGVDGTSQDEGMAYNSRLPAKFEELVRKYGEENARYLMEVYGSWHQHYTRAAFISLPCPRCDFATACSHGDPYRQRAQRMADRHGWQFAELEGDGRLLHRLMIGDWSLEPPAPSGTPQPPQSRLMAAEPGQPDKANTEDDILVVPAGMAILASFDDRVVIASVPGSR